jgi:hypothetical protein
MTHLLEIKDKGKLLVKLRAQRKKKRGRRIQTMMMNQTSSQKIQNMEMMNQNNFNHHSSGHP